MGSQRVSLPGASELFRTTAAHQRSPQTRPPGSPRDPAAGTEVQWARPRRRTSTPTGRQRHDEKITVYLSAGELIDLEDARLSLRRAYGIPVDRGRVVREAVAALIADLERNGESSLLVRRLRESVRGGP